MGAMTPPIPGFTRHRGRYRQHVTLPEASALDVAAEALRRGVSVSEILRGRVERGGDSADLTPHGAPLLAFTTTDGRRVAIYEWPVTAEEKG